MSYLTVNQSSADPLDELLSGLHRIELDGQAYLILLLPAGRHVRLRMI